MSEQPKEITAKEQLANLLEMMNAPNEESQNLTGIIYGDNGGGKTVCAVKLGHAICKYKGGGQILFIDAVNAWRSLKNHPELLPGLKRIPYSGKSQLDIINSALEFNPPNFAAFNYKVIILDEMSSMTDHDGDVVLAARSKADSKKDPDVLTQPDMGATTERMRRTVTKMLKQDISVIFVSHMRNDEDKLKGYAYTRPRFMPKFSGTIREGLDFVAFMSADIENRDGQPVYTRSLQVHPSRSIVAKTRIGGLPMHVNPDRFIARAIEWLGEDKPETEEVTLVNDVFELVSESGGDFDFPGVTVE